MAAVVLDTRHVGARLGVRNGEGPRRGTCFARRGWREHVVIGRDTQKSPASPRIGVSYRPTTPGPVDVPIRDGSSGNSISHGTQHCLPERRKRRALTRVLTGHRRGPPWCGGCAVSPSCAWPGDCSRSIDDVHAVSVGPAGGGRGWRASVTGRRSSARSWSCLAVSWGGRADRSGWLPWGFQVMPGVRTRPIRRAGGPSAKRPCGRPGALIGLRVS